MPNKIAVITAAGLNLRFRSNVPKCLMPIGEQGLSIIEHQIWHAKDLGAKDIVIILGPKSLGAVQGFLGHGSKYFVNLHYISQRNPTGFGGAFLESLSLLTGLIDTNHDDIIFALTSDNITLSYPRLDTELCFTYITATRDRENGEFFRYVEGGVWEVTNNIHKGDLVYAGWVAMPAFYMIECMPMYNDHLEKDIPLGMPRIIESIVKRHEFKCIQLTNTLYEIDTREDFLTHAQLILPHRFFGCCIR